MALGFFISTIGFSVHSDPDDLQVFGLNCICEDQIGSHSKTLGIGDTVGITLEATYNL